MTKADNIEIFGDFACPLASPNDPLFVFHHANIDRNFEMWLKEVKKSKHRKYKENYLGFPTEGYATGNNLNDPFINHEFSNVLKHNFGEGQKSFAQIIESCLTQRGFDYRYDTSYRRSADLNQKWVRDLRSPEADPRDTEAVMAENLWTRNSEDKVAFLASNDIVFLVTLLSVLLLCRISFMISYVISRLQARRNLRNGFIEDSHMIQILDSGGVNADVIHTLDTSDPVGVTGEEETNRLPRSSSNL